MSTFLEVVELLLSDGAAKASYAENPDGFLDEHGLGGLDSADVADAMLHASDALPLPVAASLDPEAGLDSAAALDLGANGLSLEREPIELIDASVEAPVDVGADVDFDTDAAADAPVEVVDSVLDATADSADQQDVAELVEDTTLDELPAADEAEALTEDLTEFVPEAEAIVETEDERLDDAAEALEGFDFTDVDPTDLDFLD